MVCIHNNIKYAEKVEGSLFFQGWAVDQPFRVDWKCGSLVSLRGWLFWPDDVRYQQGFAYLQHQLESCWGPVLPCVQLVCGGGLLTERPFPEFFWPE